MASLAEIQELGRRIGAEFKPQQVILFGSHAEGRARSNSDVDLLVVMPTDRDPVDESVAIRLAVRPSFPVDLLVRTPHMIQQRLALGDPFVRHILQHGKLLYASPDG